MKIKIALLEKDQNYLNRLAAALSSKYADKLEIYSFTDSAIAVPALNDSRIDVLVADSSFDIDFTLIPKRCGFAYFTESADVDTINNRQTVCKFQKMDLIYKQILNVYSENAGSSTGLKLTDDDCRIIAFSSPCGGTGTTTMAAACAMHYAKSGKKTLYLNFEDYGSSDVYFSGEGQFDMSDVVFAVKSRKSNLPLKLESYIKRDSSGVYFFSQAKIALDTLELTTEDIVHFISVLKLTGSFDCIIVDTGYGIDKNHVDLLKSMNAIVLVGDGGENSNIKISRALKALTIKEQSSELQLLNRMVLIYNRFSNKTSKVISDLEIKNIGGAPRYEQATEKQVAVQLAQLGVFDNIW